MNTNDLLRMLETVLPLFLMLGLGMLCRKIKLFSGGDIAALKRLVVNITLPAVMFSAFASADYSPSSVVVPLVVFGACVLALALGFALCKVFRLTGSVSPYLASGFEAGMLGYALFALLFPGESASSFAIVDLGQVLFVFTVYKSLLSGGDVKSAAKDALGSPVIWSITAGLVFGASGLYGWLKTIGLAGVLDSAAAFAAAPTGSVILLAIGYDLVFSEIRWKSTASLVLMRGAVMAVVYVAVSLINKTLLGGAIHSGALCLMFILPPPYVLPVFAKLGDERANIVSALSALTLLSIVLFAALTVVLP